MLTVSAHHLPFELVNNRQIRRNVYAAESARGRQSESMIVNVNHPANGAKTVIAVGQNVHNWSTTGVVHDYSDRQWKQIGDTKEYKDDWLSKLYNY